MKKYALLLTVFMLAGCHPQDVVAPVKSYKVEGQPYRFKVARVAVIDDFNTKPRLRTDVKPEQTLAQVMHEWSDKRLVAAGRENVLEVHLTDADIAKKELPKEKSGLEGLFTKEQTEQYDGKLSVELKLYTPERTLPIAHAEISAELSRSLREDANMQDRKRLYRAMTAELMEQMDEALGRNIQQYFTTYLQ